MFVEKLDNKKTLDNSIISFGNFDGLFSPILSHRGVARPQTSIPEGPAALRESHESSGAHLGSIFHSCSPEVRRISNSLQFRL